MIVPQTGNEEYRSRGPFPRELDQLSFADDKEVCLDFIRARGLFGWTTLPSDFRDREADASLRYAVCTYRRLQRALVLD